MSVGRDLEAICGKCGEVWHVVLAEAQGRIAKVECKQCGARHRYRPVDGEGGAAAPRRARAGARPRRRSASSRRPVVAADPSRPPRPFRVTDSYEVGERVVHARFGEGVVQALKGGTKMEVLFESGPRTLVQARDRG